MHSQSEPEPFRQPHNWSALHALETLSPPSPSTSSSIGALATLATLGDIPIFLHAEGIRDSVIADPPKPAFLRPSASVTTFRSTNTFGVPEASRDATYNKLIPDDVHDSAARQSLHAPSSLLSERRRRSGGYWNNRYSAISDFSRVTISSYLDTRSASHGSPPSDYALPRPSPSVPFSVCSSDSLLALSPSESIVISPADHGTRPPYPPHAVFDAFQFPQSTNDDASGRLGDTSSRSWSTISSAMFTWQGLSPSPSSASTARSEDFTITPSIRFRSPLLRNTFNTPVESVYLDKDIARPLRDSLPVSPISPRSDTFLTPPPTYTLSNNIRPSPTPGSSSRNTHGLHSVHPIVLPEVLTWLHDISIEIWIDQEGFRAIRPKFQLVEYLPSSGSSFSSDHQDTLTQGTVLFRPGRPETSTYHHGALDTPPVLRRLTLADSEDKDYISRQASLTIKANGVYAVTGTETIDDHPPLSLVAGFNLLHIGGPGADADHHVRSHACSGHSRLQWRFEYLVEDRKADNGRLLPGEKTVTPLSFSCSPGLLHPSHGKRIKLMHVLMKNITPKLSAAKLTSDPPPPSPDGIVVVSIEDDSAPSRSCASLQQQRQQTLPVHRRTRSSEPATAPWASDQGVSDDVARARPASVTESARQPDPAPPQPGSDHSRAWASYRARPDAAPPPRLSCQILSREELAPILASFPCPTGTNAITSATAAAAVGLSPPSYYRHRRVPSDRHQVNELGMF